jgi:hypothetical protein
MIDLKFGYQTALGRWDLYLEEGVLDLVIAADTEEIDQRLRSALRLFRGEWFLDQSLGVPYFEKILGLKGVSMTIVEQAFRDELKRQPDVLRVDAFEATLDKVTRRLTVEFIAATTDGTVPITVEV